MLIDSHVFLGESLFGYKMTESELLALMQKCAVDRAVICPVKPCSYHLEPENDYISSAVKKYPDKFIGFGRVDPNLKEQAVTEVERIAQKLNLKGLLLHPVEENFQVSSQLLDPLMEKAVQLNLPVMVEGGYVRVSEPLQIAALASRFPQAKIIATSGGQINICGMALYDAEILLTENKNVYLETSGIYRQDFIENMAKKLGNDRVIFGSHTPVMDMMFEVERIQMFSGEDKKKIGAENILKILKKTKRKEQ